VRKEDAQFVYIVAPNNLLLRSGVTAATAVVGVFSVHAPQKGNAFVQHGQAFYLMADGKVQERGHWSSKYLGINDTQLVIHYRIEFKRARDGREYGGLISLRRVQEDVVINGCKCDSYTAQSNRAFRGEFDTLGEADPADSGEFYCEELDQPIPSGKQLRALFEQVHVPFLAKLFRPEL